MLIAAIVISARQFFQQLPCPTFRPQPDVRGLALGIKFLVYPLDAGPSRCSIARRAASGNEA